LKGIFSHGILSFTVTYKLSQYIFMPKKTNIRVAYAQAVYGKEEIAAVNRVLKNPLKLAPGVLASEFEQKISSVFGKKSGIFVNSGSSANLVALEALNLPKGSEVITPILTFGTTVAPLVQLGLVPVFVDVEEGTYLMNLDQAEQAIGPKTRAIMIPSLLGNIPDLARLKRIAKKHNLLVIDDSADTIGASFAIRFSRAKSGMFPRSEGIMIARVFGPIACSA
jgi:CDP-6-deoxy-D-xylo-4-hexulose-3-dehydrase